MSHEPHWGFGGEGRPAERGDPRIWLFGGAWSLRQRQTPLRLSGDEGRRPGTRLLAMCPLAGYAAGREQARSLGRLPPTPCFQALAGRSETDHFLRKSLLFLQTGLREGLLDLVWGTLNRKGRVASSPWRFLVSAAPLPHCHTCRPQDARSSVSCISEVRWHRTSSWGGSAGGGQGPRGICLCNPCPPAPERLTPAWAAEDSRESGPDRRPGVRVRTGVWGVVSVLFSGLSRDS